MRGDNVFVFFVNNHHYILQRIVCVSLEKQLDTSGRIASRGGGKPRTNCDFTGDPDPIPLSFVPMFHCQRTVIRVYLSQLN